MVKNVREEDVELVLTSYTPNEIVNDIDNFNVLLGRYKDQLEAKGHTMRLTHNALTNRLVIVACEGARCKLINVVSIKSLESLKCLIEN